MFNLKNFRINSELYTTLLNAMDGKRLEPREDRQVFVTSSEMKRVVRHLVDVLQLYDFLPDFLLFTDRIIDVLEKSKAKYCVLMLKEMSISLMKWKAGEVYVINQEARIALDAKTRLPSKIPINLRHQMMFDDNVYRAVLSVLSLYRNIQFKGVLKVQTITDPLKEGSIHKLTIEELKAALYDLKTMAPLGYKFEVGKARLRLITSAGPNNRISAAGSWYDSQAFLQNPKLMLSYVRLAFNLKNGALRTLALNLVATGLATFPIYCILRICGLKAKPILGRLAVKEEAAGKRRIFAITDYWTQCLLAGLHEMIYAFLRELRTDGTWNQSAPLETLRKDLTSDTCYSFDLSAATDRLPVTLQEQVLSLITSPAIAADWKKLLTERDWYLKKRPLRYAVGQPMGAYSSWGMLALTHHLIVKVAARRVGKTTFDKYAILGDDVVIIGKDVAQAYKALILSLGMDISTHKSLVSDFGYIEFAKRLIGPKSEVTPIGGSSLILSSRSWKFLPTLLLSLYEKGGQYRDAESVYRLLCNMRTSYMKRHKAGIIILTVGPGGLFRSLWTSTRKGVVWTQTLFNKPGFLPLYLESMANVVMNEWLDYQEKMDRLSLTFSPVCFQAIVLQSKFRPWIRSQWTEMVSYLIIEYVLYVPNLAIRSCERLLLGRLGQGSFVRAFILHLDHLVQILSPASHLLEREWKKAYELSRSAEAFDALFTKLTMNENAFEVQLLETVPEEPFEPAYLVPEEEHRNSKLLIRHNDAVKLAAQLYENKVRLLSSSRRRDNQVIVIA